MGDVDVVRYETDYWEHSYLQGIRWVEAQFPKGTRIHSGFVHAHLMVDQTRFVYVDDPDSADVYLGATRFVSKWLIDGHIQYCYFVENRIGLRL